MRLVVTGAGGFLGWRTAELLEARGHEVVRVLRPGGVRRRFAQRRGVEADVGDPDARRLLAGCDAVLHFAGIPDPGRGRADPAWAVRMNAGTTLNLLEGCLEHRCGLVYPSTVRAADPPDPYAVSKRLGEDACRLHRAPASVVRLTSVFGPGQVAAEGATGAIASFAARALAGEPIVVPGNARRTRDFVYVDDLVPALERVAADSRWGETFTLASGTATPLVEAAGLVRRAAGSEAPVETPGGSLPAGEDESYAAQPAAAGLGFDVRPLEEAVRSYVEWLRGYSAAESGS